MVRYHRHQLLNGDRFIKSLVSWRLPEDIVIITDYQVTTDLASTSTKDFGETTERLENSSFYYDFWDENITNCMSSENCTFDDALTTVPTLTNVGLAVLLYLFCLATIFGNTLVIIAVAKTRSLHSATNYLIASLAVADTLVGLLVMPFSATYEGMDQSWIFGPALCDIWHSFDVLASTSSILHLCVISLDRYWAITDPFNYPIKMSDKRAASLIVIVWVCSVSISFPAIAWWRLTAQGPPPEWKCPFTEDIGYLVFSSTVSFYGPLAVMVFTYIRIYQAATAYSKSLTSGTKSLGGGNNGEGEITLRIHRGGGAQSNNGSASETDSKSMKKKHPGGVSRKLARFSKETKAAKTLGTVMGVFIICWLPFFVTNVIAGICPDCISNPELTFAILTWLGWVNSSMNPVIYACCSHDFRRAFVKILRVCCGWKHLQQLSRNTRSRFENFSSSGSSQDKDFGFQNRPRVVANAGNAGNNVAVTGNGNVTNGRVVNHTIIVTPVKSSETPKTSNNGSGVTILAPTKQDCPNNSTSLTIANTGASRSIRQNICARYAVNYRSLDSSSSSTTMTPVTSSTNSSWDEAVPSIRMKGGRGQSYFPVKTSQTLSNSTNNSRNSLYSIPPPNFHFRPGISGEKLV